MSTHRVNKFVASLRQLQANDKSALKAEDKHPSAAPRHAVKSPSTPFFDPQLLGKLGQLELIARTVVDGFLSGKHRSTHKGGCTDFAEFRPYSRGDDIRLLDWRHYARSDKYYVKRFDDETNLQALLVVDMSGSMSFGMSTVSKWRYAQMATACLAHLLLRQRDSAGLALVGNSLVDFVKPQPRADHLARLLDVLGSAQPGGPSNVADALTSVAPRLKRRGMAVYLSDCFGDVDALAHSLQQYRLRGHDVLVVQLLAPEELSFPFRKEAFFQDLELHGRMQVNPNSVRQAYLQEFQAFMERLRVALSDIGVDLLTLTTSDNVSDILAYHLRRRAAMKNPHRATVRA